MNIPARVARLEQNFMLLAFQLKNLHGIAIDEALPTVRREDEIVAWNEPIQGQFFCLPCGVPQDVTEEEWEEIDNVDRESIQAGIDAGQPPMCETCGSAIPGL